jgi:hypothetical protein
MFSGLKFGKGRKKGKKGRWKAKADAHMYCKKSLLRFASLVSIGNCDIATCITALPYDMIINPHAFLFYFLFFLFSAF